MNILFYDMGSYTYKDILSQLQQMGHTCKPFLYRFPNKYQDQFFCDRLNQELGSGLFDIVFSVNFFPLVAQICNEKHIKYISWVYDSPMEEAAFSYFEYETNYIFLFDRMETESYQRMGYTRVFHLPLAVNTPRIDKLLKEAPYQKKYLADVSFIGQLYSSNLDALLLPANPYTKGYIEGIIQAQIRIYGYDFIDELIPDEILNLLNTARTTVKPDATLLTRIGFIHAIHKHITQYERTFLLEELGARFHTQFYAKEKHEFHSPIEYKGPVDYYNVMPYIFRTSKLNLCPTLRSIHSGIPLRALDIMASRGALLSNFQPELAEYFQNEVDVIMYDSMEDAIAKAAFYIQNDSLREQIARNGYEKTKEYFNYPRLLSILFEIVENN